MQNLRWCPLMSLVVHKGGVGPARRNTFLAEGQAGFSVRLDYICSVMPMLAILNGWELVLLFAVILFLFAAKNLTRGLGEGFSQFQTDVKILDDEAYAAGESFGGIYGKPAAEALTPDNQTAEIYDPAVFHRHERRRGFRNGRRFRRWLRTCRMICHSALQRLRRKR